MKDAPPSARGLWLWIPGFLVLIVAGEVVDIHPTPLMQGVSFTLFGLAVLFAGLPFVHLRRHGAVHPGDSYMATTVVARHGLYAIVRHPQYLGYDFLVWGLVAATPHWATILPAAALTVAFSLQARAEERHLLRRFGEAYRAYMQTVPRFGVLTGLLRYGQRRWRGRGHAG